MMTERKAAQIATAIYAAVKAGNMTGRDAMGKLDRITPYMSMTQLHRYSDFAYCVRSGDIS